MVNRALRAHDSLFSPGQALWTRDRIDDLTNVVADALDGDGTFIDRLASALVGKPDATAQVGAEVMYVHLLVAGDLSAEAKQAAVDKLLESMKSPASLGADLRSALDEGIASAGIAFRQYRGRMVAFLGEAQHDVRRRRDMQIPPSLTDAVRRRRLLEEVTDEPSRELSQDTDLRRSRMQHEIAFVPRTANDAIRRLRDRAKCRTRGSRWKRRRLCALAL